MGLRLAVLEFEVFAAARVNGGADVERRVHRQTEDKLSRPDRD